MFKLTKKKILTIASGFSVGTIAVWYSNRPITPVGSPHDFQISKAVKFSNNKSDLQITLFQYQTCPFCCKVRSYLDYYGINYKIVEVNSVTRKQLKWSQYRKVPIAYVQKNNDSVQINDSSVIISLLESYRLNTSLSLNDLKESYPQLEYLDNRGKTKYDFLNKYHIMLGKQPEDIEKSKLEIKWRQWVDETFVHSLSPNIYRTPSEALDTFNYVSHTADWEKNFGVFQTKFIIYVGSLAMFVIGKMLKRRHHLKDDVRESLFDQAEMWTTELNSKMFMGGQTPNLSDLAMYGALLSIEGCSAFNELMEKNNKLKTWFFNTRKTMLVDQDKAVI